MPTLADRLLVPEQRNTLIQRCVALVEHQIDSQSTMRRLSLKAGVAVLNTVKPNALHLIVNNLLGEFTDALNPLYQRFNEAGGGDFSEFLQHHPDAAVSALIAVTDERAARLRNATVRRLYGRLRPTAETEVRAALPGLSRILAEHLAAT